MRILFIADNHFSHERTMRFEHRPWDTVQDMDREMIRRWNDRVREDDHVYIVGDLCSCPEEPAMEIVRQLKGHLHLIRGNHEHQGERYEALFEETADYLEIQVPVRGLMRQVVLSHYFMPFYAGVKKFGFMLHGHTHRSEMQQLEDAFKEQIRAGGLRCEAYNVGAVWQDYAPQTLEEIIARQGREVQLEPEKGWECPRTFWKKD